jgi:hypothetical protein
VIDYTRAVMKRKRPPPPVCGAGGSSVRPAHPSAIHVAVCRRSRTEWRSLPRYGELRYDGLAFATGGSRVDRFL